VDDSSKQFLHNQLIKLGDMIGDGLADEPDGKWIRREYRKTCKALGYINNAPRTDSNLINERMKQRLAQVKCKKCNGELKQTRSGSMRGQCKNCGAKYQLMKKARRRA